MRKSNVTFSLLFTSRTLNYRDITRVTISRSGFIQFITKGSPSGDFAFAGAGTRRVVDVLMSMAVPIDATEFRKVGTARVAVTLQIAVATAIVGVACYVLFAAAYHIR